MDPWELGWARYDDYRDIDSDDGEATFLIGYEDSHQGAAEAFSKLKDNLRGLGFSINVQPRGQERPEDSMFRAWNGSEDFLIQEALGFVAIRSLKSSIAYELWERIIEGVDYDFLGELEHGIRKNQLEKSKGFSITTITGPAKIYGKESVDDMLLPTTFYLLKKKNLIVGKALLKYYNFEMAECAPTIVLFEIKRGFRRKGTGSLFLRYIEEDASDNGFFKIWASDMKTSDFWRYHQYNFDLEEGEKYLV